MSVHDGSPQNSSPWCKTFVKPVNFKPGVKE